jgi:hypothetical protein
MSIMDGACIGKIEKHFHFESGSARKLIESPSQNRKSLFLFTSLLVLCVGVYSVSSFQQANADAGLMVSPTSGAPGSVITISGWGFSNNTQMRIFLDYERLGEIITTEAGTFTQIVAIPIGTSPGTHRITGSDNANIIEEIFTVTAPAKIAISPNTASPGTSLTILGSNFSPNTRVIIRFDDAQIPTIPFDLVASASGTFSTTVQLPKTNAGSHVVSATDDIFTASEKINVREPSLVSLSAKSGPTGTLVTVIGSGFSPNSSITVKFDSTALATIPSVVAASSGGTFSAVITIPIGIAAGTGTISAVDGAGRSGSEIFSVTASGVVNLTPTSAFGGSSVTVSGSGFNPNSVITLRFDSTTLATSPIVVTTTPAGTFSGMITVPTGVAVGGHTISATDESGRIGSTVFDLNAPGPLSLSRDAGIGGSRIKISGVGFSPNSDITIKFGSLTLTNSETKTNADGTFEATFTVPGDATVGTHAISVTDSFGRTATSLFTVRTTAILSASPQMGPPGSEVTVTGSKFINGTRLSIRFDDLEMRTMPGEVVGSALGKFLAKFHIPNNITAGTYMISAEDETGITALGRFTVINEGLSLTVAQDFSTASTISITGSGFSPDSQVTIKFDDELVSLTNPTRVNTTSSGTFSATFNAPGLAGSGRHVVSASTNDITATTILELKRHLIDDRYGILISVVPDKYDFSPGETLAIGGKVLALDNGFPLLLKVINPNNAACSFQQLTLDQEMNFKAEQVGLQGPLCSIEGEYKITAFYGRGKSLTKFKVGPSDNVLTGGQAEVINSQIIKDRLRYDNRYTIDLDWATNAVLLRNNVNQTLRFYLMFIEYDANEITKNITYTEVSLEPFEKDFVVAPYVPRIVDGKPNGYLHVFAWTALNSPTPLHPGLYVPY